jgi:cyclophilin family peptidyl-prolyl cis-trans isomerase
MNPIGFRRRVVLSVALLVAALTVALVAAGGASGGSPEVASVSRCKEADQPLAHPKRHTRPPQTVAPTDRLVAYIETNCGQFQIKLDAKRAPTIVNSFVYLARAGYYNGLRFDRVIPNFVVEGGDPTAKGLGGPGYSVTEPPPAGYKYHVGSVLMARTLREPAGRAGSDFFVVVGRARYIEHEYALLGEVKAGMNTVERIAALGQKDETPSQVIRIDRIRIKALR